MPRSFLLPRFCSGNAILRVSIALRSQARNIEFGKLVEQPPQAAPLLIVRQHISEWRVIVNAVLGVQRCADPAEPKFTASIARDGKRLFRCGGAAICGARSV